MTFVADLFRPLSTLLVTLLGGAFLASVAWPPADAFIEGHLPAWSHLDPAVDQIRAWLGIHQPAEPDPWWRFWR